MKLSDLKDYFGGLPKESVPAAAIVAMLAIGCRSLVKIYAPAASNEV